ncbi:MAG: hypothetical protein HYX68_26905 [Planctomycetes bacterium]|nr:hypothetical protein [Planctomycetota bacterium]
MTRKLRWGLCLIAISAASVGVAAIANYWWKTSNAETEKEFPFPPYSKSRHLNTGPNARYVGTDVCAGCHRGSHKTYLGTAHSRALSEVNPATEPPDASFEHKLSGRSYRVYRKDNRLWHEEVVRSEGQEIARIDLPVRYLVGSGNFSRTYIVEFDGFLHESPITWYTSRKKWDMSPGYDHPQTMGFERPIVQTCIYCHAGLVEQVDGAAHRLRIHEKAIGCESCHGPGSLHQEFHQAKKLQNGDEDLTIVNPRKLSRPLQEDICATCHMTGAAPVILRGRTITDYRPGTPLSDYRVHYRLDDGSDQMMVVGHVEQMRQSACYKKSELTCLTCHDPHERAKPKDAVAAFRKICMDCHARQPCTIDPAVRIKKDGTDNCTGCHMPRGDTDIPHIAFTHHRIGHHAKKKDADRQRIPQLIPIEDVKHLASIDQERNLGLALEEASRSPSYAEKYGAMFRAEAKRVLDKVYARGLQDPETLRVLMDLEAPISANASGDFARQILKIKDAPPNTRASALINLARSDIQSGDYSAAIDRLREYNKIYNSSTGWRLLGTCYVLQNQPKEALLPLQKGLELRPYSSGIHEMLATAHGRLGQHRLADVHKQKADALGKLGLE